MSGMIIPPEAADATAILLKHYLPGLTGEGVQRAFLCHREPQGGAVPSQPRFLTILEVADILGVSRDTVIRLIKKRVLGATKIGGQWRIPAEAIDLCREQAKRNADLRTNR